MPIASLILGIVALVLSLFSSAIVPGILAVIVGAAGIVLGVLGKKKLIAEKKPAGMATAGLVMSIIAVALGVIFTISCYACYRTANTYLKDPKLQESMKELEKATKDPKFQDSMKELEKAAKDLEKASKTK